jgi:hypothetical protein
MHDLACCHREECRDLLCVCVCDTYVPVFYVPVLAATKLNCQQHLREGMWSEATLLSNSQLYTQILHHMSTARLCICLC